MPKFSRRSLEALNSCDPRLVLVAFKAIEVVDFSVIEGGRDIVTQEEYVRQGKSQTMKSKHLITKENPFSRAFDFIPYPFNGWDKRESFALVAGVLIGIGHANGIKLRWGGDWNYNFYPEEENFYDGPHVELLGE